MSDHDLRALERLARIGDSGAARALAVERFRRTGDCGTGLCGNAARPGNPSVNNKLTAIRPEAACPSCRDKEIRREAVSALALAWAPRRLPTSVTRFARGEERWETHTFRDHSVGIHREPGRAKQRRRAILVLNRTGTGWIKEVRVDHRGHLGWTFDASFEAGEPPEGYVMSPTPIVSTTAENVYAFSPPGKGGNQIDPREDEA